MKLICYLSNGYPNLETTIKLAREYAKSGCDVIEIDFPAKNPYLESPYISERMSHALDQCNDYE
ncbi:MAG: tryptophan synthase subunit alpha, partial [Acholeplasmataceae bacterium]|nr:tryptophan synthase subunit alpha [Acholeplasmataceae bacterium]